MPKHSAEQSEFIVPQLVPDDEPVPTTDPYESTYGGTLGFGAKPAEAPRPRPERSTVYSHGNARLRMYEDQLALADQAEQRREAQMAQTALGHQAVTQALPPSPRVVEQAMPTYGGHTFYPDQPNQ